MRRFFTTYLVGTWLVATWAISATALADPGSFRFDHLSLEDGLSQSTVYAVVQTSDGFLWLGTENGLNRYDGYEMRVIRGEALPDNVIQKLIEDRTGILWIGTFFAGAASYDIERQIFTDYRHDPDDPTSLSGDHVTAIVEDHSGTLWIGTYDGGLDRFDRENGRFVHVRHGPQNAAAVEHGLVTALVEDPSGRLWIGTGTRGLDVFGPDREHFHNVRVDPDQEVDEVVSLLVDSTGSLWIGTAHGLWTVDPQAEQPRKFEPRLVSHSADWGKRSITALHQDPTGRLWVGTGDGLFLVDPDSRDLHGIPSDPNDPTRLTNDDIRTFYRDRSGLLWIGTAGGGANRYDERQHRFLRYLETEGGLSDALVWSVHSSDAEEAWIGTHHGGLNRLDLETGEFTHFRADADDPGSLTEDLVLAVHKDHHGIVWAGTWSGEVNRLNRDTGTFRHYPPQSEDPNSPGASPVTAIHRDRFDDLWVSKWGGGLELLNPETGTIVPFRAAPNGPLESNKIRTLIEGPDGTLWIGTQGGGLVELGPDRQEFRHHRHRPEDPTGHRRDRILALGQAADGDLWIATGDGELIGFDPATRRFDAEPHTIRGAPEDLLVYAIQTDHRGDLWLSSNRGLWQLSPETISPETWEARQYHLSDGLQGLEFNAGASYLNPVTGELFFGGLHGLNRFHPEHITADSSAPRIVLTAFKKFNQDVTFDRAVSRIDSIDLSFRDDFVAFELAVLDFRDPGRNRYVYKLEGQDRYWVDARHRRLATYTNLRGGEYSFRFKGANGDGTWSEVVSVAVRVKPPLWDTWPIRSLAAIGVVGLWIAGSGWKKRSRRRRRRRAREEEREARARLLDARENERVRLARELHDGPVQDLYGVRLELKALSEIQASTSADEREERLLSSLETLRRASDELRGLCRDLRPMSLAPHGLAAGIRSHARLLEDRHPIDIELTLTPDGQTLPEALRLGLYRIVQECLNNAVQHAAAQEIRVLFELDAERCVLEIEDDGQGFTVPERWIDLARGGHLGLLGIAERVDVLGGSLEILSQPGEGTRVHVEVPRGVDLTDHRTVMYDLLK